MHGMHTIVCEKNQDVPHVEKLLQPDGSESFTTEFL